MKKFLCKLFGHNFVSIQTGRGPSSVWGWFYCSRCRHKERYQFVE